MLPALIVLSVALFGVIVYLNYRFYQDRQVFRKRIRTLEEMIVRLTREQHIKDAQVHLSDELRSRLRKVNATLNNDIFDFNHELLQILAKNKLL